MSYPIYEYAISSYSHFYQRNGIFLAQLQLRHNTNIDACKELVNYEFKT